MEELFILWPFFFFIDCKGYSPVRGVICLGWQIPMKPMPSDSPSRVTYPPKVSAPDLNSLSLQSQKCDFSLIISQRTSTAVKTLIFTGYVDGHWDYLPEFFQNFPATLDRVYVVFKNSKVGFIMKGFRWRFENTLKRCNKHSQISDRNFKKIEVGTDR